MSGLYDMIFPGGYERGALLIPILAMPPNSPLRGVEDFGRYRDAFLIKDGMDRVFIQIYTRCGGANRTDYAEYVERMRRHPWYQRDADDDYDCTYANFYFLIPEDFFDVPTHYPTLRASAGEPVDTGKRWQVTLAELDRKTG